MKLQPNWNWGFCRIALLLIANFASGFAFGGQTVYRSVFDPASDRPMIVGARAEEQQQQSNVNLKKRQIYVQDFGKDRDFGRQKYGDSDEDEGEYYVDERYFDENSPFDGNWPNRQLDGANWGDTTQIEYPELVESLRFGQQTKRLDPCDDFYKFVCDGYHKMARERMLTRGAHEELAGQQIIGKLFDVINDPKLRDRHRTDRHFSQMYLFYQKCLSEQPKPGDLVEDVKDWLGTQQWTRRQILLDNAWLKRAYPFVPFFRIRRVSRANDAEDYIYLLPLSSAAGKDSEQTLKDTMRRLMVDFHAQSGLFQAGDVRPNQAENRVDALLRFDQSLQDFNTRNAKLMDKFQRVDMAELGKMARALFPFNWQQFFQTFLGGRGRTVFAPREYFTRLANYVNQLALTSGPELVSDHLKWHYIWAMLPMAQELANPHAGKRSCLGAYVMPYFKHLLDILFIESQSQKQRAAASEASTMLQYVRIGFRGLLADTQWVDPGTKRYAMEKLEAMKGTVGNAGTLRPVELQRLYGQLQLRRGLSWLNTMMQVKRNAMLWPDSGYLESFMFNAAYMPELNRFIVMSPLLQLPLFNRSFPDAFNFGALGYVMGHEITHGFDTLGREYDKAGQKRDWWDVRTRRAFEQRKRCFERQYATNWKEKYRKEGHLTTGEDIADNGGLKAAFAGWQRYRRRGDANAKRVKGLEQYSEEQLFFISNAFHRCEVKSPLLRVHFAQDEHSYTPSRVNLPLSNFQAFADAFQCAPGTRLNPSQSARCELW